MGIADSFLGTGVALITPFNADGSVDYIALSKLVQHVIQGGVDYLVVLGTTAESATLNESEKQEILRFVANENAGRLPLVAGVGGNDTLKVAKELNTINLEGYDAILSVTPYYNRPSQEGIYQHFSYLAQQSPLPLLIYNVPSRTGVNMLPETVGRLAKDHDSIIGVKEACGDMAQVQALLDQVPEGFKVISGDDATAVETVLAGGSGVISVLGQALPELFADMIRAGLSLDFSLAKEHHARLSTLMNLIFKEGNPAGIKGVLEHLGICDRQVRLPLVAASLSLMDELKQATRQLSPIQEGDALKFG